MGIGRGAAICPGLAVHQSFLKGVGVDWHARGDSGRERQGVGGEVWGETGGPSDRLSLANDVETKKKH